MSQTSSTRPGSCRATTEMSDGNRFVAKPEYVSSGLSTIYNQARMQHIQLGYVIGVDVFTRSRNDEGRRRDYVNLRHSKVYRTTA